VPVFKDGGVNRAAFGQLSSGSVCGMCDFGCGGGVEGWRERGCEVVNDLGFWCWVGLCWEGLELRFPREKC